MSKLDDLTTVNFSKGAVLFEKGDKADCAYIIQSGGVVIVARTGGQEAVRDTLTRGDFVGEMALVDNQPRSAAAIVGEDASCAVITKEEVEESIASADLLAYALLRLLTKRLRKQAHRGAA